MQYLAKNILQFDAWEDIFLNLETVANSLQDGKCIILKSAFTKEYCKRVRSYLNNISSNTFPNYYPISNNSPNHFRINLEDDRASVKGFFYQFNFFPHNQDLLNTFNVYRMVFEAKDKISALISNNDYLYNSLKKPPHNYISRVGYQFYPINKGYLSDHSDIVGSNQYVVPTILMSKKGHDFISGGFFYIMNDGTYIYPEDYTDIGDMIFFNPRLNHGVELVRSNLICDQELIDTHGRWMGFATTSSIT
ncbi:hypothetical protein [Prochlorococcus marinus]|uniref:hypothetical protein n=1 Tax=Prochlorococcus marinus TaxID=1219 RepID=UPI0022B5201A|nr:hypothetical protein [Prochlorococcus marinus]